jgi:putative membrane protein
MWDGGWHGWFFGPLMMVFWLAILVGVVVLALRLFGIIGPGAKPQAKPGSDALDILRERFARGEIDKAEFEERRTLLEGGNQ